jgi:hypothetical protein
VLLNVWLMERLCIAENMLMERLCATEHMLMDWFHFKVLSSSLMNSLNSCIYS